MYDYDADLESAKRRHPSNKELRMKFINNTTLSAPDLPKDWRVITNDKDEIG